LKLTDTKDYSVHLLLSNKGDYIDTHYHTNWDESWYILEGSFEITINGKVSVYNKGEFVMAKRNISHKVVTLLDNSKRLAIFKDEVKIYYEN